MFAVSYNLRSKLFIHYKKVGAKMPKPFKKFFDREEGAAGRARRAGRRIADRARSAVAGIREGFAARRNRRRNR